MKAVSNTSPLINLAWIGPMEILHEFYGTIHISQENYDTLLIAV